MKKILITLMLLISSIMFSQTEYKKVYTVTYSEENGYDDNENIFMFNYKNTDILKVITATNGVHYFTQLLDFEEGTTVSGYEYTSALFLDQESNKKILFQIFKIREYGLRMTFPDLTQIQFFE